MSAIAAVNMDEQLSPADLVLVDPGNCGFACSIGAVKKDKRTVVVDLHSDCRHIQRFDDLLVEITMQELFLPLTRNPVFRKAEEAGCHNACPVPVAVIKTVEVVLELAVPQKSSIIFPGLQEKRSMP